MPTHAEIKQATRDRFLEAGFGLFTTQGLEAVSVRDIVKASGLSQGAFYNHFQNHYFAQMHRWYHALDEREHYHDPMPSPQLKDPPF